MLSHSVPNPAKPVHSVFSVGRSEVLGVVDEAWLRRGAPVAGSPGVFMVPMGRPIGTLGEQLLRIVVKPGTNEIVTAYPVIP